MKQSLETNQGLFVVIPNYLISKNKFKKMNIIGTIAPFYEGQGKDKSSHSIIKQAITLLLDRLIFKKILFLSRQKFPHKTFSFVMVNILLASALPISLTPIDGVHSC